MVASGLLFCYSSECPVNFQLQLFILKLSPLVTSEHMNSFTRGCFEDYFWFVYYKHKVNLHFQKDLDDETFSEMLILKKIHLIVSDQSAAFCFLEMREILLSIISGGAMPSSKYCTIVAFPFSSMRFLEYLQFAVFSQVLIKKQQHKKLWIVPELNMMRVLSFGLAVWVFLFLKGKETGDVL